MDEAALAWCRRLIGCRSVTREGTRAIAELCARELLAPRGIEAQLIESPDEGPHQVNLVATIRGRDSALSPIVLNTHLDTVPPGEASAWTACAGDPFTAVVTADRIYGLGAADTKLDFIAKVMGLTAGVPRRNVILVATFGEEHGLVGARELARSATLPRGVPAFVGEASHLQVITAHKGLMVFELRLDFSPAPPRRKPLHRLIFAGRAAHSSTPALGRNAIRLALDALAAHRELEPCAISGGDAVNKVPARCEVVVGGSPADLSDATVETFAESEASQPFVVPSTAIDILRRFIDGLQQFADTAGPPEPDYASPTLTCNPGLIRTHHGTIVLEFELRPPPSMPLDEVRAGLAALRASLQAQFDDCPITLSERRANPGFRADLASETVVLAVAALATANLPVETNVKAGCTEAGVYAAAGLKPVVFGPGPSTGVIHAPNEYNLLSEVEGAIRFYRALLQS